MRQAPLFPRTEPAPTGTSAAARNTPPLYIASHGSCHVLLTCAALLTGLHGNAWSQNIYRSVDSNGRVTFSDRLDSQQKATAAPWNASPRDSVDAAPTDNATNLPFSVREARSKFPVTLYTTGDCTPCDGARRMLVERGVPYTERSVISEADQKALRSLSGQDQLPFATVGKQHLIGWDASEWQRYLDLAGYPSQSAMPAQWKPAAATPLTTPSSAASTASTARTAAPAPAATSSIKPADGSQATPSANPARAPAPSANPAGITF